MYRIDRRSLYCVDYKLVSPGDLRRTSANYCTSAVLCKFILSVSRPRFRVCVPAREGILAACSRPFARLTEGSSTWESSELPILKSELQSHAPVSPGDGTELPLTRMPTGLGGSQTYPFSLLRLVSSEIALSFRGRLVLDKAVLRAF